MDMLTMQLILLSYRQWGSKVLAQSLDRCAGDMVAFFADVRKKFKERECRWYLSILVRST